MPDGPGQNQRGMTESTATGAASVGLSPDRIAQDPKAGPQQTLTVLYLMSVNVLKLPGATPEQMVIGDGAARALQEFVPNFFTAANKPAGATDAAWTEGRTTMEKVAKDTLMILATKPGFEALNRYGTNKDVKECVIAEDSYRKALQQYPDSAQFAYQLGRALRCQQASGPDNVVHALNSRAPRRSTRRWGARWIPRLSTLTWRAHTPRSMGAWRGWTN